MQTLIQLRKTLHESNELGNKLYQEKEALQHRITKMEKQRSLMTIINNTLREDCMELEAELVKRKGACLRYHNQLQNLKRLYIISGGIFISITAGLIVALLTSYAVIIPTL